MHRWKKWLLNICPTSFRWGGGGWSIMKLFYVVLVSRFLLKSTLHRYDYPLQSMVQSEKCWLYNKVLTLDLKIWGGRWGLLTHGRPFYNKGVTIADNLSPHFTILVEKTLRRRGSSFKNKTWVLLTKCVRIDIVKITSTVSKLVPVLRDWD